MFGTVTSPAEQPPQDDLLQSLLRAESQPKSSVPEPPTQQSAPVPTENSAPASPGSFTQMFQSLKSAEPAKENVPEPPPVQSPAPAAEPGSFTQMFESLKAAEQQPTKSENVPPPSMAPTAPVLPAKPAADLTSVFTPVSINKPAAPASTTPVASGQKPGEFTQLLSTLNNPILKAQNAPPEQAATETQPSTAAPQVFQTPFSSPESGLTPVPVPDPVAQTAGPGVFTQMFQTLSPNKPPAEAAPAQAPPSPAAPPEPAAAGGFTQMFQSLSGAKEPAPAPQPSPSAAPLNSGPGSFTQMFSQISGSGTPQEDPLASLKPQTQPADGFQFSNPVPASNPNPFGNTSSPSPGAFPAKGGFTQLFQALEKEESSLAKEPPPLMPAPPAASGPPSAAGGFTQLLQTLNTPQSASVPQAAPPSVPTPSPAPMPLSGPGEFTRVISSSMLREAQGQNPGAGGPPVVPAASQPSSGQPVFQMPQTPAFPKMPAAAPPIQQMPHLHAGGGGGAAPQMPHFQPPAFQFPPAPAPAPPQPPAPGKLQQYLPLILIVNVFVLIVVILIVVFALRHH